MFSNSICVLIIGNSGKTASVEISTVSGTGEHVDCLKSVLKQELSGIRINTFLGLKNVPNI